MQNIIVTPDEMTANAVISLPSNVNLDGNGNTIYASDAWDERFENAFHVISVEQGTSSIENLTIVGNPSSKSGIHVYGVGTRVTLNDIAIHNCGNAALQINGAVVTA